MENIGFFDNLKNFANANVFTVVLKELGLMAAGLIIINKLLHNAKNSDTALKKLANSALAVVAAFTLLRQAAKSQVFGQFFNKNKPQLPPAAPPPPIPPDDGGPKRSLAFQLGKFLGGNKYTSALFDGVKPGLTKLGLFFASNLLTMLLTSLAGAVGKLGIMFMQKANENAVAAIRSGTTNTGALHALSVGLGISGDELGHRARAFGDLLTQGGIPAGLAAQMGIKPYGGIGGDQNYFNKYKTALSKILNEPNEAKAGFIARQFGMEDLMWARNLDDLRKSRLINDQGNAPMGSEELKNAAIAQYEFNKAFGEFQNLLMHIGKDVLPLMTSALKNFALIVAGSVIGALSGIPFGALIGGLAGWGIGHVAGSFMDDKASKEVINNNTNAVKSNTEAIWVNNQLQMGTYGGGKYFQSGIPKGWGSNTLNDAAMGRAISLGAFTV